MSPSDGLLTLGLKHDVELAEPHIIAPEPFASDDCFDDFSPEDLYLLTAIEEPHTMLTGEDEPSSGLNGRLRPRKSNIPSPQTIKTTRKTDPKSAQEKPKRTSTPSKASPNKPDDLTNKSDSPALNILCPYCDKTFFTKQAISKHIRRIHILTPSDYVINCLYCNHAEADANDIIRHMVDNHPNQYFACYDCHTRFPSTTELAEHKLNVCEKQKLPYRNKLRPKSTPKKSLNTLNISTESEYDEVESTRRHEFNGLVISCELKPSHAHEAADIEDNITTNFILPPTKNIGNSTVIEKNAVIILDDLQWNKRMPNNFSFHNTDADQILSRLGVVHRSPRAGEFNKRDWSKNIDESNQKFEKCFDTSFYSKVASNVQENLSKFLDGSFNFNPDPENTIKTRRAKNSVAINTVEGFPILLECEQFSRTHFDRYLPRALAPKHKLKWDTLENDRNLLNPEQIKRDSHTNNCIISLVSSLDIWTQLCMRQKFEEKFNKSPIEKKTEKQNIIGKELKEILESRELPAPSSQIVKYTNSTLPLRDNIDFPASLGLIPSAPSHNAKPAVLSGEWVRPRCYVCCACGAQTRDSRALSSHISARHPNAQIQHYEIVGDVLLKSDILKHLYVPPSQLNNRTRPLRGIRECTKCKKSISLEDLHQHMLDCAGDTPAVRRKCRYRPFGVRKRRPRLPDNTIRREMRKDINTQHNRKNHMRTRPKIRTEVGDAETIRKMLADLPAKRHRVTVNPLNPILRPRRKLNSQRNKLLMKKRPTEDMKKKPLLNTEPRDSENENFEKRSIEPENSQSTIITKPYVKLVDSKILCNNETLNKKPMIKNKRKNVPHKEPQDHCNISDIPDMTSRPPDDRAGIQFEQLSTQNNTDRIIINNGGGGSHREHGNGSNNGSSNRDNNNCGYSGEHNNFRDSFGPSQNIPLKHSIASLTASSETHDKSVQFHHLFLVQQECNNVTNHVPSGHRMLFENEAVVRKLDKPPLHFNHRGYMDPLLFQKSKLNKPRKGLNDCIAMLKNKLEDPCPSTLPLHVSVQCGSDEPLGPEPIVIERRHSTTESNNESTQRSLQMLYPEVPAQNSVQYQNIPKRPTRRRSTTTRQRQNSGRDKSFELLANNDYINWKQYYYESQMLSAQNNKRQPARRKSMTPADEFLLQHAFNIELLNKSSRELQNLSEYHYANLTMPYKQTKKKSRENTQKSNARGRSDVEVPKSKSKDNSKTREKSSIRTRRTRVNSQPTNQFNLPDTNCIPLINRNDQYNIHHVPASCTYASGPEKNMDCCTLAAIQEENINICLESDLTHSKVIDEQTLHHINQQSPPVVEYTSDNSVHQSLYTIPYESTVTAPLDLSNNVPMSNDNSLQYLPQTQFCSVNYETYETLDLSNKHLNNETIKETDVTSGDVVDLSLRFSSHPPQNTRPSPIPSDLGNNDMEEGPTDLSLVRVDDYIPTDLSVRRKNYPFQSYERTEQDISQINYIQNLTHPMRNGENICVLVPLREGADENEHPTDLSKSNPAGRPDVTSLCLTQQQDMYLNVFRNNPIPVDNIPADLSGRANDVQNVQYLEAQPMNVNDGLLIHESMNRQSSHRLDNEQIVNLHYNSGYRTPVQTSYDEDSDRFDDRSHNMPAASIVSPSSIIHDYSNTNSSLNDHSLSHSNEVLSYPNRYSDEPLSLTTNSSQLESNSKALSVCNILNCTPGSEVANCDDNTPIYSLPNDRNCTSPVIIVKTPSREKTCNSPVCNNTECLEMNMSEFPIPDVEPLNNEINTTNKLLSTQNCKEDNSSSATSHEILDQDPETARKIAMLPKELVEILGNMPVDHRNQLLNVLPQYVSTSATEPNLIENSRPKSDEECCTPPMKRNIKKNDILKHGNTQDKRDSNELTTSPSQMSICSEAPHISVSSSVLLTPPTPQLSDRHSIQSQDNEVKTDSELIILSTENRTHLDVSKSDKQQTSEINMSIVKRLTHLESDITEDSIIDLTGDDYLPSNEYENNSECTKRLNDILRDHSSSNLSGKSSSHKNNNDKTASLRAVRIKTPSERHRSILTDQQSVVKNTTEKTRKQVNEQDTNKHSELQKPLAIQQAEISSTQHNKLNNANNNQVNKCSELHISNELNQQPQNQSKSTDIKHNEVNVNPNITTEKLNFVTSSIPKDVNSKTKKDALTIPDKNVSEKSNIALIISSSDRKVSVSDSNTLTKNIFTDALSIGNIQINKSSSIKDKKDVHNKEDSEYDPIMIIQKNCDSNIPLGSDRKVFDKESNISDNEDKNQCTNKESEQLSTKLPYVTENLTENKRTIDSKDCGSQNWEESIISKASIDISVINQDSEKQSKMNEIISHNNQKGKRGRRPEQVLKTKYAEAKDQVTNQSEIYKKEINKENNYYSDSTNKDKSSEDFVKSKELERDVERISAINTKVTNNINESTFDKPIRNENLQELLEKHPDSQAFRNNASVTIKESDNCLDKVESTVKQVEKSFVSDLTQNSPITDTVLSEKETSKSETFGNIYSNLHSVSDRIKDDSEKINDAGNILSDKNVLNSKDIQVVDISSDVEEVNTTPVRRSRRGKSVYVHKNNIETETTLHQYTNEPKAPLTKKQLIFSKLLLDEENHNNNKDSNDDLEIEYKSTKSLRNNDLEIQEFTSNKIKANKRKKSPQSKRKSKKQKSLTSLKTAIDIINDKSETDSKNNSVEIPVTNIIENDNIPEVQDINCTDANINLSEHNFIRTAEANGNHTKQRNPIEKRKSSSPPRLDLVQSSKPKKCKLNIDEENMISSPERIRSEIKQVTETDIAENIMISPTLRNTTCYNKPIRRVRSKSVVEKSSGSKLYDPYDIDLEDMVEKTEPFIRKENAPKNSNFKTSIIDKTRKLTAPSADIETYHLDNFKATSSASISPPDNSLSKNNNKIIFNSETSTKDSDTDVSSKSDEPLKKNAVEKEKRKPDRNNVDNVGTESKSVREKSKTRGRKKRTLSSNTKDEQNIQNKDNEEELRSEQFMESFGFFSERKPRKSNLLATKKISETFHIIANENDDVYFSSLDRINKKSVPVNKQADEVDTMNSAGILTKKVPAKRGRKKKSPPPPEPAFCNVCKKAFRRSDNYTRHQISLYHISKLSEVELNTKTIPIEEEPNYLIVFKQQLDRLKIMQDKIALRKKNGLSTSHLVLPTLQEILEDVKRIIREQILARRGLSRDEALFVDCCEMLKESHKNDIVNRRRNCNSFNCLQACEEELAALERSIDEKCDKYDGVVDSITAKNIMESEEVRNLENDLISGLKEANGLKGANINYHTLGSLELSESNANTIHVSNYQQVDDFDVTVEPITIKTKRNSEVKDKMYPDVVDNIDMFEDKFDKIKRKCRSQAAAAKQIKTLADVNSSHKNRKKSEKKKAKRGSQQNHNTVPTKGALKGFDGIKVSISTSDINMSAIVPSVGNSFKRKKKSGSKKKRDRKNSDVSSNYDSDHHSKNKESSEKKVDVYEFMDTEDTELFEFRPSTLMERFRSISNKEIPSTSKTHTPEAEAEVSSESGSDGDDFVYMSDDYVCSDDETENSILSCEFGNVKGGSNEYKKPSSPLKRKDVIEKNAVMGKIFKHNAVRSERRRSKSREPVKTQANMDQLFDSLLEDKPKSSMSPKKDIFMLSQRSSPPKQDKPMAKTEYNYKKRNEHIMTDLKDNGLLQKYDAIPSTSTHSSTFVLGSSSKKRKSITPPRKLDLNALRVHEYSLASPKNDEDTNTCNLTFDYYARSSQRRHGVSNKFTSSEDDDFTVPKYSQIKTSHSKIEDVAHVKNRSKDKVMKDKSYSKKRTEEDGRKHSDSCTEVLNRALVTEDAGVAVQRARRKCTVGKQNVLAETWSSESEPDGAPPRPSSVESVVPGAGRKKRGRKRDGGAVASRRGGAAVRPSVPTQARPRPPSYWSEGEDEHPQQHGWIVGDSHKKLVTMLAHAKGRKRSGDDKRTAVLE